MVTQFGVFDFTYRQEALGHAQTAVFVAVMQVQWSCLLSCKTRKLSILQKGVKNIRLDMALLFESCLAICIVYIPVLNYVLGTRPLRWCHLFIALPFTFAIITYDESRKFLVRNWPQGWIAKMTYY